MIRIFVLLLGMLTASRPGRPGSVRFEADDRRADQQPGSWDGGTHEMPSTVGLDQTRPLPAAAPRPAGPTRPGSPPGASPGHAPGRPRLWGWRRIPRWARLAAVLVVASLIFRRAVAWLVLAALSAALHLIGINAHLPHIKFAWPWQTITAGTSSNISLGPWVLQKIEGISRPALGQASFDFYFTHKVSKNIGFWPCWYSSTFYAVGRASATVDLNPGPAWWKPATGHYLLRILRAPGGGSPGQVAVTMVLPRPQLPQSVHDVVIDNLPSKPLDTQHSWTYPGLGCGLLIRPQFAESVLYAQAQQIAFAKASHSPQITGQLVRAAETQATQTIRDNFIQPTVNALGYTLSQFNLRWASG
ncbi:MAG TPA: hypothetical protein VGS62_05265 [Streptosporangiaceae bacterium]|nr:hypothetical protein [Streptosporangiaceae bacterium]